jgi:hypothetical protein
MTYIGRRYMWTRHKLVHAYKVDKEEIWLNGKPTFAEIGRTYGVESPSEGNFKIASANPISAPVDNVTVQEWRLADRASYLEHSAMNSRKRLAKDNKRFDDLTLSDIREQLRLQGPAQRAAIIAAVLTTLESRG